ncbi:unnamed protein product [Darwinula stevensoni]|uniref:CARD domain-containing protein n=1 Tax=Darwinula stevensoni TaxID=69355 RepID=A0A7R8XG32_9CRUS|nr:unnamed protein product [Darwinula stevensoni]CAG0895643.1 unnamed protein product [Darwinula stevensoni]
MELRERLAAVINREVMLTDSGAISAVIAENLQTFRQRIELDEILLCLKKKSIIEHDEYIECTNHTKNKSKIQADFILEKIPRAGDKAFPALLECLNEKYPDFVETLLKAMEKKDANYAQTLRDGKYIGFNFRCHQALVSDHFMKSRKLLLSWVSTRLKRNVSVFAVNSETLHRRGSASKTVGKMSWIISSIQFHNEYNKVSVVHSMDMDMHRSTSVTGNCMAEASVKQKLNVNINFS